MGERELAALLSLSSLCLVIVVWLFLAVPWVCLRFVVVVFPDQSHLLFLTACSARQLTSMWNQKAEKIDQIVFNYDYFLYNFIFKVSNQWNELIEFGQGDKAPCADWPNTLNLSNEGVHVYQTLFSH